MPTSPEFDLVLWGATGYAERLATRYLAVADAHDGASLRAMCERTGAVLSAT
ncbi:hypothetical protein AB0I98_06905 [Streptomyces sp. NPDC050211]|uniref:hypothetical protein n=1 Tax=Streptomyces sp. NPDC050211 TaxID=3154932 RepID=UPI0034131586